MSTRVKSTFRYCVTLLVTASLLIPSLQPAWASPSGNGNFGNDFQSFAGSPAGNGGGVINNVSGAVSGAVATGARQAISSPMPLRSFQISLSNMVRTGVGKAAGSIGQSVGGAVFGQAGAGIGGAIAARAGYRLGAGLASGNLSNIRMPGSSGNPIPGAILGAWLGNILSSNGFRIPPINIPGLGGAANGAINSALNDAVGGAIGGALGSALGGGNVGQGAIQGALGGAAGGALGSLMGGGMGMGSAGGAGRTGPDGFPSSVPRIAGMPNSRNPINGATTNPFGMGNSNPLGNIFGQAILNVIVQSILQQFGIPAGGVLNSFGGAGSILGSAIGMGSGASNNTGTNTFSSVIANRVGESTFNVPGTNNGNVACAWVVNDVYRQMTGRTITGTFGQPGSSNMLVKDTIDAMRANPQAFRQVTQAEAIASGQDYIIGSNYAYGGNGSHIGWGNGNSVWSNSSGRASIQQNYTPSSWQNQFGATQYFIPVR